MCPNFIIFSSYLYPSVTKFVTAILPYLVLDCIIIIQSFIIVLLQNYKVSNVDNQ